MDARAGHARRDGAGFRRAGMRGQPADHAVVRCHFAVVDGGRHGFVVHPERPGAGRRDRRLRRDPGQQRQHRRQQRCRDLRSARRRDRLCAADRLRVRFGHARALHLRVHPRQRHRVLPTEDEHGRHVHGHRDHARGHRQRVGRAGCRHADLRPRQCRSVLRRRQQPGQQPSLAGHHAERRGRSGSGENRVAGLSDRRDRRRRGHLHVDGDQQRPVRVHQFQRRGYLASRFQRGGEQSDRCGLVDFRHDVHACGLPERGRDQQLHLPGQGLCQHWLGHQPCQRACRRYA